MAAEVEAIVVAALALVLVGCWAAATARHRRVRGPRTAEWEGPEARAGLWTSGARCPACGSGGGLVEPTADGGAVFTCLSCDARHVRRHRS